MTSSSFHLRRTSVLVVALAGFLFADSSICIAQEPEPDKPIVMAEPKLPFIQKEVCPFECCTYRRWTATKPTRLYNDWRRQGRKLVGTVKKGERVIAATGVVVTYRPSRYRAMQNDPRLELKIGDEFPVYSYRGEGTFNFWSKGKFYQDGIDTTTKCGEPTAEFAPSFCVVSKGEIEWWAQVKTTLGKTGWVWMDRAEFDHFDACG